MQTDIVLVLDNIRSAHNVGAIWRTAEAAGVSRLVLCGLTPHPPVAGDHRLPYVTERDRRRLAKTALGAERYLPFEYQPDTLTALTALKHQHYHLVAVEQSPAAIPLYEWQPRSPLTIVLGAETTGLSPALLSACNDIVEIPMHGRKESLNVSVAAGIILFNLVKSFS